MAGSTVSLTFKIADDGKGLKTLTADADSLRAIMGATVTEAEQLGRQVVTFSAFANTIETVNNSINQFKGFMQGLTSAYAVQQEAETKLETVMRQRMAATAEDIQGIKDLCSAQQQLGVIGDEVQLAGAQQLATFLKEKQSLTALIPAMNDLVAQQKGLNATGGDAVTVANMMGKALTGQTSALRRVGICFDDAQEKMLKYGNESERAAILAEIITANVGHVNAELAKTESGKFKQLTNELGDYKEMAGRVAAFIQPTLTLVASLTTASTGVIRFYGGVKTMVAVIKSWGIEQRICNQVLKATGIQSQITAMNTKTLSGTIGGLWAGCERATKAIKYTTMAIRGLMTVFGLGLAYLALTSIIGYLSDSADDAADSMENLTEAQKNAKRYAEDMEAARKEEIATGERVRKAMEIDIRRLKEFNGTKAEEKKLVDDMNSTYGEAMGYFASVSGWYDALIANSEAYCRQIVLEARTRNLANKIADNEAAIDEIKYNEDGSVKKYSKERTKYLEYVHLDANGKEVSQADRDAHGLKNVKQIKLETKERSDSDYDKAVESLSNLKAQNDNLNKRLEEALKESSQISFSVKGSDTRPDTSGDNPRKAEEDRKANIIAKDISELGTYEELDIQRSHYQEQWKKAPAEMRPAIKQHLDDLNELEKKWKKLDNGFTLEDIVAETPIDQLNTYEEIGIKRKQLSKLLQSADGEERESLQKGIKALDDYKAAMDRNLKRPADISQLNNVKDLTAAISYLKEVQQTQNADEVADTEKVIAAHERKLKAMQRGIELTKQQREVDDISKLSGKEFKVKVRSIGFDELSEKIKEINNQLGDFENPPTEGQKEQLKQLRDTYEQWRKECVYSFDTFRDGWSNLEGSVSGIQSITSALEGNGNAWEKITGVVNGFIRLYDGINGIINIINMITAATKAQTMAEKLNSLETENSTAALLINTAASQVNTVAKGGESIANATAAGAKMPFPMNLVAIAAGVAAVVAALAMVGSFATGGIVGGSSPTGDKLFARVNSGEMILNRSQQSRLFNMLNGGISAPTVTAPQSQFIMPVMDITPLRHSLRADDGMSGKVEFEIKGRKLYGVLKRVNDLSLRS